MSLECTRCGIRDLLQHSQSGWSTALTSPASTSRPARTHPSNGSTIVPFACPPGLPPGTIIMVPMVVPSIVTEPGMPSHAGPSRLASRLSHAKVQAKSLHKSETTHNDELLVEDLELEPNSRCPPRYRARRKRASMATLSSTVPHTNPTPQSERPGRHHKQTASVLMPTQPSGSAQHTTPTAKPVAARSSCRGPGRIRPAGEAPQHSGPRRPPVAHPQPSQPTAQPTALQPQPRPRSTPINIPPTSPVPTCEASTRAENSKGVEPPSSLPWLGTRMEF
eukprot:NODE_952_length_1356_cov_59.571538_g793_i0.p1 GENE.NODE_952_length_1356_cov_59.571538_g793_i0~~NODE_952_length_1356_cov_59.571538_g793_i0.p1  ORF type:complete len:278 (+),score=33.44 NODE_952_length_1356_cov_59.571538_g793_i0:192-1025(+)